MTLTDEEIKNAKELHVYTDGACSPNPGPGGWSAVILNPTTGKTIELSGAEANTSNNRMEMMAALKAMAFTLKRIGPQFLCIHTDSKYVYGGITEWIYGWEKNRWLKSNGDPVKNADLWQLMDKVRRRHKLVRFKWVPGHAGETHNERADVLAVAARKTLGKDA